MQKIRNWQIEWATKEGYIERERERERKRHTSRASQGSEPRCLT